MNKKLLLLVTYPVLMLSLLSLVALIYNLVPYFQYDSQPATVEITPDNNYYVLTFKGKGLSEIADHYDIKNEYTAVLNLDEAPKNSATLPEMAAKAASASGTTIYSEKWEDGSFESNEEITQLKNFNTIGNNETEAEITSLDCKINRLCQIKFRLSNVPESFYSLHPRIAINTTISLNENLIFIPIFITLLILITSIVTLISSTILFIVWKKARKNKRCLWCGQKHR